MEAFTNERFEQVQRLNMIDPDSPSKIIQQPTGSNTEACNFQMLALKISHPTH